MEARKNIMFCNTISDVKIHQAEKYLEGIGIKAKENVLQKLGNILLGEDLYEKPLSDTYKTCMYIGNAFKRNIPDSKSPDWNGTEECATLAEVVCFINNTYGTPITDGTIVIAGLMSKGYITVKDHGYDVYARGFLAGEILGFPNDENIQKAEKAEKLWLANLKDFGYYQEVLEKVRENV